MKHYEVYNTAPPRMWTESIPIGCGRMGATLMGGVAKETFYLNEETIWAENKDLKADPNMKDHLQRIKALFLENKPIAANRLADRLLKNCFPRICSYEGAGKLNVELHEGDSASDYAHRLDLVNGIATVSYRKGGSLYRREYFASHPDNVIACRITSSKAPITAYISYERDRTLSCHVEGNTLTATAKTLFGDHEFCVKVRVVSDGNILCEDGQILVSDTKSICIYTVIGTQFRLGDSYVERTCFPAELNYDALKARHIADFSALMSRADIELPELDGVRDLPLRDLSRLRDFNKPKDHSIFTLQWQYGRYLLISSSREDTLPSNLQGIWTDGDANPWSSDYHTNINVQANYWGVEVSNLSECHNSLFRYMNDYLLEPGKRAAKEFYGTGGCVVHHLSDIYGFAAPADGPWGLWPHGASWLALHMWEHYLFTGDTAFLKNDALPFIKEATEFFLENLSYDVKGRLVYAPSTSPENRYYVEEDGQRVACFLASGSTMDIQIISTLFGIYLQTCELLGIETEDVTRTRQMFSQLPPMQIGKHGQLMEWLEDYDEAEPGHRHISHAFGLYPAAMITRKTPELCRAIETTILRRLSAKAGAANSNIGWADTWRAIMFARLRRPDRAYGLLQQFVSKTIQHNLWELYEGRLFQIDANLAYIASLSEMLLQSHEGVISLLPALPEAWDHGSFRGLCARGGYTIGVAWEKHCVTTLEIKAGFAGECKIELPPTQASTVFTDENGTAYQSENGILTLNVSSTLKLTAIH